jgi:ATP-binding cassette subfamily A (ABC1) protein 2
MGSFLVPRNLSTHLLQANETFAFVGNVTHYAQVWLNISAEIRSFLEQGRLQQHLHWLQQVLWVWVGGGQLLPEAPLPGWAGRTAF